MKKYWSHFVNMYQYRSSVKLDWDENEKVNTYFEVFTNEYPLDDTQEELARLLLKGCMKEPHPFQEFRQYLSFLIPVEDLEKVLILHEKAEKSTVIQENPDVQTQLLACMDKTTLPESVLRFIQSKSDARDRMIMTLGLAYVVNNCPNWLPQHERQRVLFQYRNDFQTSSFVVESEWFLVDNVVTLTDYQRIMHVMENNEILRLSVLIACANREQYENLAMFVEDCKNLYEEIKMMMSELKKQVERKEITHA